MSKKPGRTGRTAHKAADKTAAGKGGTAKGATAARKRAPAGSTEAPIDPRPVLLLGVGNILYGDEGLGVYVVHRLRRAYKIPTDLRIIDGGAAGWHLEPYIAEARRVVIVDAVAGQAGSVYRFSHRDIPASVRSSTLMSHELEIAELLGSMENRGELPPTRIIAMGVTPAMAPIDHLSMGLSPEVETRLPALELVLLAELADAGVLLEPRSRRLSDAHDPSSRTRRPRRGQHA
ncbi:MAG: hydrogenase maturation protease [Deinococcales bacterium]